MDPATSENRGPTFLSWLGDRAARLLRAMNHAWLLLAFAAPFLLFFYVKATLPEPAAEPDVAPYHESAAPAEAQDNQASPDPSPADGSTAAARPGTADEPAAAGETATADAPAAADVPATTGAGTGEASEDRTSLNWGGLPFSEMAAKWLAIISSVAFFGALGSTVSIYARTSPGQEREDRKRTLIGGQILGAVFATLLFLSFVGALVQGSIFPAITVNQWDDIHFTSDSWARLMVWSFIAGFSERFVPDLLNNFTMRGGSKRDQEADGGAERSP